MFEQCIYFNINKLTRRVNRIWEQAFKAVNLSPSHGYLLRVVLEQPGITCKALAEVLDLKLSTVTRFVDTLVAKDLLERKKASEDKRESNIYPTKKAKKIEQTLLDVSKNLGRLIRHELGENDVNKTLQKIKLLNKKMDQKK